MLFSQTTDNSYMLMVTKIFSNLVCLIIMALLTKHCIHSQKLICKEIEISVWLLPPW